MCNRELSRNPLPVLYVSSWSSHMTLSMLQVVLVLDQREQFSRSIGGRQHNRVDALSECSRQLSNLGISVEARPHPA